MHIQSFSCLNEWSHYYCPSFLLIVKFWHLLIVIVFWSWSCNVIRSHSEVPKRNCNYSNSVSYLIKVTSLQVIVMLYFSEVIYLCMMSSVSHFLWLFVVKSHLKWRHMKWPADDQTFKEVTMWRHLVTCYVNR